MKTILCWLFGHVWEDSKPSKNLGPGEQRCERCGDFRHHIGKDRYDQVDWKAGPLPS